MTGFVTEKLQRRFYWDTEPLIVVGLFTALNRAVALIVALVGGGLNPVTMVLKNGVATALLVVMVARVRRFGVLVLYTLVGQVIAFLVSGGTMITLLPGFLLAALLSDSLIAALGGYKRLGAVVAGVALYDLVGRILGLCLSYLQVRESPGLFTLAVGVTAVGYLGCLLVGLPCGVSFVKELRHAGIIREI